MFPVVEHARGRDGVFRLLFACKEIAIQIRRKQQRLCLLQCGVFLPQARVELIDRVKRHGRDARARKQRLLRHDGMNRRHPRFRSVAIAARVTQQRAVVIEQAKVHTPRVDAEAIRLPSLVLELEKRFLQVSIEPQRVPVIQPVLLDHGVVKPVHLRQRHARSIERAQHRPPVGCTQVECE
ncbi:hypothetical protein SDC9_84769 [bioreactor metagenome]|uniref:Uncharacterized protein n=1 Tax=bioreactor metagenome TaxID=1076179 RepID=A0A644ZB79_9ZZZZ